MITTIICSYLWKYESQSDLMDRDSNQTCWVLFHQRGYMFLGIIPCRFVAQSPYFAEINKLIYHDLSDVQLGIYWTFRPLSQRFYIKPLNDHLNFTRIRLLFGSLRRHGRTSFVLFGALIWTLGTIKRQFALEFSDLTRIGPPDNEHNINWYKEPQCGY